MGPANSLDEKFDEALDEVSWHEMSHDWMRPPVGIGCSKLPSRTRASVRRQWFAYAGLVQSRGRIMARLLLQISSLPRQILHLPSMLNQYLSREHKPGPTLTGSRNTHQPQQVYRAQANWRAASNHPSKLRTRFPASSIPAFGQTHYKRGLRREEPPKRQRSRIDAKVQPKDSRVPEADSRALEFSRHRDR